jgi:hypothetical protein
MARKNARWIQKAVERPGSLRRAAERAGALTRRGTIRVSWLKEMANRGDRRAGLALTLRKLARRRARR